jgi:hypothetical protein
MKTLLALLLLASTVANAQHYRYDSTRHRQRPIKDSSGYYQNQLWEMRRAALDSLSKTPAYKEIEEKIKNYHYPTNDYSSFVLFMDATHTDYSNFNKSIAQDGFPPMDPVNPRFGFGISMKSDWAIIDVYYLTMGTNATSKKGEEKIRSSLTNFLQVDLGYDFIDSRWISMYPYAGLSFRVASLSYYKPDEINPNFTNITNVLVNHQSISSSSLRIGYQAGLGIDVVVERDKKNSSATVLFIKAGTLGGIGKERHKFSGLRYEPGIKRGDWNISVGVKFTGR